MSLNKIMLIGNVGKDPEVKYVSNAPAPQGQENLKVARFTLATTERYKAKDGSTKENTEWHNIVVWRQLADVVEKYVTKGSKLYVEGKIYTRSYEGQAGQMIYRTEVNAEKIELLGSPDRNTQSAVPGGAPNAAPRPAQNGFDSGWKNPAPAQNTPRQAMQRPVAPVTQNNAPNYDDGKDDLPF